MLLVHAHLTQRSMAALRKQRTPKHISTESYIQALLAHSRCFLSIPFSSLHPFFRDRYPPDTYLLQSDAGANRIRVFHASPSTVFPSNCSSRGHLCLCLIHLFLWAQMVCSTHVACQFPCQYPADPQPDTPNWQQCSFGLTPDLHPVDSSHVLASPDSGRTVFWLRGWVLARSVAEELIQPHLPYQQSILSDDR